MAFYVKSEIFRKRLNWNLAHYNRKFPDSLLRSRHDIMTYKGDMN